MNSAAAQKYDPNQAVELPASTNSMENRRVPNSMTSKVFSGSVRYVKDSSPIEHFQLRLHGTDNAAVFTKSQAGKYSWITDCDTMPFPEQLKITEPVLVPRIIYSAETRFVSLQKWECTVLNISHDSFTARLIDLTGNGPDEEAEFSRDEVDPEDIDLLETGAVFYWNIGYRDRASGRERISTIRFRRLPVWTADELKIARQEASRVREKIAWK